MAALIGIFETNLCLNDKKISTLSLCEAGRHVSDECTIQLDVISDCNWRCER